MGLVGQGDEIVLIEPSYDCYRPIALAVGADVRSVILNAIFLAAFAAFMAIPLFGWLSDRFGRKTMFYASSLFAMAFAFPLFQLLDTKNPAIVTTPARNSGSVAVDPMARMDPAISEATPWDVRRPRPPRPPA